MVSFRVPAFPGRAFQAPIARNADSVGQATRTMAVELDVTKAAAEITPGTFASVEWPVHRSEPSLVVPSTAITTDLQRTFVICLRQGKAEWVDVKTGITSNGKTEVFGDLKPGEPVVRNATDAIRPGTALSGRAE
jgi:membrane fusion protein (multidrug efflux system)